MSRYAKKNSTRIDIIEQMFNFLKNNADKHFLDDEDDDDILTNNKSFVSVQTSDYDNILEIFIKFIAFYSNGNFLIDKDFKSIDFDWENCEEDDSVSVSNCFPDGTQFIWCYAGGDWEDPIEFIFYLDNRDRVRAFIPKDGNVFCPKCNHAYGSCKCNPKNQSPNIDPDYNKMYNEIVTKIRTM
jgi:hypothetical protein